MKEMINLVRGALLLDSQTFTDLKASPDVFRKGFTLLVIVGLIVGVVVGLVGMVQSLMIDPLAEIAQARTGLEQMMKQFPGDSAQILENAEMGFKIAERITKEAKPPLLPHPVGVIFRQLGVIVSQPFSWLGSLLLYGVLVQVFAKLLGGRGTIAQMWGLTSLTVVPHLLDALSPLLGVIPVAGVIVSFLVGLTAFVWGVIIYVKGTAVAHEMSGGRALFAVLLPIIVTVLVALLLVVLLVVLSAAG